MTIDEQTGAKLAAYLDGEVAEKERRAVEALIERDPEVRRALDEMRQSRQLLQQYDTRTGDSTMPVDPTPFDLSGQRLDHFITETKIGQGGMGQVYRALDTSLDRPVAIKLISSAVAGSSQVADRFVREARLQAQIDHPHVAHIYHIGRYEGRLYFAMEYLPGGSLQDRFGEQNTLDPEEAIDIIVEVADILEATRRRGIVHRDLKPSNIMFTADGKIKLTDFGLSKAIGEDTGGLTESGALLGTPHYISPEGATGGQITWRSDMYSLGCTLYRLLFGRAPYVGKGPVQLALAHVREPFPEPEEIPAGVSPELLDVLRHMMAKNPDDRFPDYPSLIDALNSARPRVIEPISPWKRVGIGLLDFLVAAGLVLILSLMAAGMLAMLGRSWAPAPVWALAVAVVGVMCAGAIPALSGNTLVQGVFAMKVRPETSKGQARWRLLWRGLLASPVGTLGLLGIGLSVLPQGGMRQLIGVVAVICMILWHSADFAVALLDSRRRMLHDILSRTRLQHVTYED